MKRRFHALALLLLGQHGFSDTANSQFDAATAFGARESVANLSLSPDGTKVAYVAPLTGQGSSVLTRDIADDTTVRQALVATGDPERIDRCNWAANDRLVCVIYWVVKKPGSPILAYNRVVAVNPDGTQLQLLSTRDDPYTHYLKRGGGNVIDWLPDEDGAVLMTREFLWGEHSGAQLISSKGGLGVDRINTRTLQVTPVEWPRRDAEDYITDGHGTVRVMALSRFSDGQDTGITRYLYRRRGSRKWEPLSQYNSIERSGLVPYAVDFDQDIAYGLKKKDGRRALYSIALDGTLREALIYERPDVDVEGLIRIGRRQRVVGVSYVTDSRKSVYFDPAIQKMMNALSNALPTHPILQIAGSTTDEGKFLIFAGSDDDPGVYYLFDRQTRHLDTFLVARAELEGIKLARVKFVSYPANDGTMIPAYLTLPPGRDTAMGLPAIVLPHGGPSARDEWGFDWLSQFFASRGFAVLQPNFRGSSGYGDAWFIKNGFQSWPVAVGDVLAAGRWMVSQGIADPGKLGIVGWSYGGYAALQSAVLDDSVFKAVVAIAPVTDLDEFKVEHLYWSDFNLISEYVGSGPHIRAGSPADHADKIKVPVLLFHGALDINVSIKQSQRMVERLAAAHAKPELVTWEKLDHYLEDSGARQQMLNKSDAFLRRALGLAPD